MSERPKRRVVKKKRRIASGSVRLPTSKCAAPSRRVAAKKKRKKKKVRRLIYLRARIRDCPRCGEGGLLEVTLNEDSGYLECVQCHIHATISRSEALRRIRSALPKEKTGEDRKTQTA